MDPIEKFRNYLKNKNAYKPPYVPVITTPLIKSEWPSLEEIESVQPMKDNDKNIKNK